MSEHVKNLVVGCGLSGMVVAERIASQRNEPVLIIDKRSHIAGNIYDEKEDGITIHRYGPHAFHTNDKRVWEYMQQFTDFYAFQLRVTAWVDGQTVPIPFNFNSMERLFPNFLAERLEQKLIARFGYDVKVPILELRKEEDADLAFLADFVYKNVFEGYTLKQWGQKPEEIDPTVTARVPVFVGRDDRYFQDTYQGIPLHGYTAMAEKMLAHPLIKVQLNTTWSDVKDSIRYERLFFTGSIDEFFDYSEGVLPYRSVYFVKQSLPVPYAQPTATVNYPTNYEWTRVTEHKYFLNEQTEHTILMREFSEAFEMGKNEPYYPIVNSANTARYQKYQEKASKLKDVYFLGRLGSYQYMNMDQVVKVALDILARLEHLTT